MCRESSTVFLRRPTGAHGRCFARDLKCRSLATAASRYLPSDRCNSCIRKRSRSYWSSWFSPPVSMTAKSEGGGGRPGLRCTGKQSGGRAANPNLVDARKLIVLARRRGAGLGERLHTRAPRCRRDPRAGRTTHTASVALRALTTKVREEFGADGFRDHLLGQRHLIFYHRARRLIW